MSVDPAASYVVTLKDVADQLNAKAERVDVSLNAINITLATLKPAMETTANHETRLQVLERYKSVITALGVGAGGGSGVLTGIIYHLLQAKH